MSLRQVVQELAEDGVLAIEWSEKLPRPIQPATIVRLTHGEADTRTIAIYSDR